MIFHVFVDILYVLIQQHPTSTRCLDYREQYSSTVVVVVVAVVVLVLVLVPVLVLVLVLGAGAGTGIGAAGPDTSEDDADLIAS